MNHNLQKEIIRHTLDILNVFPSKDIFRTTLMENLLDKKYIIDKQLIFDDNNKSNIWAATSKIDNLSFKIMIADISEGTPEFVVISQTDNNAPCGIRLALDELDNGTMMFSVDKDKWLSATILQQAKVLIGFERLASIYVQWTKLNEYEELHKYLLGFLKFVESNENQ